MGKDLGKDTEQSVPKLERQMASTERVIMRVFLGACALSALIIGLIVFAIMRWGTVPTPMFVSYSCLLVWALVVIGYCFYSLLRLAHTIEQDLGFQSFTDELTGVFNFRYLEQRLTEEYERTRRKGGTAAVLFMDLDKFKKVNDDYGHAVGNTVLRDLAQEMRNQVRSSDVLGRVGGDEFVVLMPDTQKEQAKVLAKRLCNTVDNYRLDLGEEGVIDFVRVSIGIAGYPDNGDAMAGVITAADNAVYEAKKKGGGCMIISDEFVTVEGDVAEALPQAGKKLLPGESESQ